MNSLHLLEIHRRKVAFVLAAITTLLLYLAVLIFEFFLMYIGKSDTNDLLALCIFLLILFPGLYSLLSFIACRVMHRIYKPIRESISNLENFTTNVNHEFKTSLSEIISSLELWEITKNQSEYTPKALSSAKRLNIILDSLTPLIQYTNSSYRKKNTNITKVFDEVITDHAALINEKNITIHKKYTKNIWSSVDVWPLTICFQNILANAIKYNNTQWEITISISKDSFEIHDTGKWIEEKNLDKIFERRFQEWKDSQWLGVGLSLVKRICDMYHWDISIESQKDIYTTVKISF